MIRMLFWTSNSFRNDEMDFTSFTEQGSGFSTFGIESLRQKGLAKFICLRFMRCLLYLFSSRRTFFLPLPESRLNSIHFVQVKSPIAIKIP